MLPAKIYLGAATATGRHEARRVGSLGSFRCQRRAEGVWPARRDLQTLCPASTSGLLFPRRLGDSRSLLPRDRPVARSPPRGHGPTKGRDQTLKLPAGASIHAASPAAVRALRPPAPPHPRHRPAPMPFCAGPVARCVPPLRWRRESLAPPSGLWRVRVRVGASECRATSGKQLHRVGGSEVVASTSRPVPPVCQQRPLRSFIMPRPRAAPLASPPPAPIPTDGSPLSADRSVRDRLR